MSNIWHDISEKRITPEDFICVIEISKGSKKKYELDKETGYIILDRILYTSTHYPANYGFIPRTLGDDGDPLDILLLCSEALEPLILCRAYPIGYISMIDNGKNDEKSGRRAPESGKLFRFTHKRPEALAPAFRFLRIYNFVVRPGAAIRKLPATDSRR